MKARWFMLGLAVIAICSAQAKDKLALAVYDKLGEIEIHLGDRPVLVYAFATNQFKPYVRELYTLSGQNVLLNSPPDHLHHHGMMYAARINGVNFWEETDSPGIEKSVKLLRHSVGRSPGGLPQAKFTQLIHWLTSTNRNVANSKAVALLIERRTLSVTVDKKAGEVAVQWDAAFEVGRPGKITWHGSDYNGLGVRLPPSFDHVAVFKNSENSPYVGPKTRDSITALWTSVTGTTAQGEIMLALFGKTTNPGGNASFFTLLDPFAYLSATQGLDKKPLEYAPGDKFHLSYLLTVYNEPKPADFLQRRYEAWSK